MTTGLVINEEVRRLQEKLDSLKRLSSRLWEKKEHLLTFEKPRLCSLYQTLIGQLKYDEFSLMMEIRRLRRKAVLIQVAINRNVMPDDSEIEKKLEEEFEEYRRSLKEYMDSINKAKNYLQSPALTADEGHELSSDYRLIAKKLHPDINPGITEAQKELFIKAVAAYKSCDLNTLRQIVLTLDTGAVENLPAETLSEQIGKLNAVRAGDLRAERECGRDHLLRGHRGHLPTVAGRYRAEDET